MSFKSIAIVLILLTIASAASVSFDKRPRKYPEATLRIARMYANDLQRFDSALKAYPKYFYDSSYTVRLAKYQELLYSFKQIECLFTYFHPKQAYETFLLTPRFQPRDAGPPFPDNWIWIGPFGIDEDSVLAKFTKADSAFSRSFITRAVNNFRTTLASVNLPGEHITIPETELFEALRLQLARISTIGLAAGDMVVDEATMPGLDGAFDNWSKLVKVYAELLPASASSLHDQLIKNLHDAGKMIDEAPSANEFNRMQFLVGYLLPLAKELNEMQEVLNIPQTTRPTAFNRIVPAIYDKGAINTDYFLPYEDAQLTEAKITLGRFLFFDPILSDNNQRACASCHKPEMAFTDGFKKSVGFERENDLPRNSPTVINAVFQKQQFWDLRAGSLEDQLDSVINNREELHSSFENVIAKVNASEEYRKLFYEAFPEARKTGIQRQHVKIAIASYERTLTGMNSRFDQYVQGDHTKLNAAEVHGFNVFMGKAKCGSCHFAPLFNGAFPPYFDSTEHRALGVPVKDTMEVFKIDPDTGLSRHTGFPLHHFSFKVPTVRNAELTAPYMHNGVYKTLEQVVEFYDHAAGTKFTKEMRPGMKSLPFFMVLPKKLNLNQTEKEHLVLFLKTLTDTTASQNIPGRLPMLAGKYASLNKRKLGGEY